ncbi:MAG TPA: LysR family transcriptional regulator [Aliidongia sp.]|uniref:LysR family transcriptional regulator n=1 Tax=Aliidongia sp. TaxID=1914230 RepID=UPI002DDCED30|nr:LysR family transcriptional regulator [Aliidongia sp.]HEV2675097.1 LysR family transcriptional regulator [Aliidongia sp.]
MDTADLRVFEAVARLGGMGRAAEELHTVQSNVTARIRHLEEQLGTPLFHRHARGVAPTPAGLRLLPYAQQMALLVTEARRATLDDGTPRGPLVVGALETTTALRLADALSGFVAAHPAVDLTIRTGTTCELLDQVLGQRVEGAFVCGPIMHPELDCEPCFTEELCVFTASTIRSLDELTARADLRIVVLKRGCSYRQRLEELLARRGIPAPRVLEFGTPEAVLACVAAGMGVTLLPRGMAGTGPHRRDIALHALEPRDALVETVFVRRRDSHGSSALAAFLAATRPAQIGDRQPVAAE